MGSLRILRLSSAFLLFGSLALCFFSATTLADDKEKKKKKDDDKIKEVIQRQKGDQLEIYLSDKGIFVNGKSLSHDELTKILKKTKLKKSKDINPE